jgi:diguanylate cyclase
MGERLVSTLGHEKLADIYLSEGGALLDRVASVVRPHIRETVNVFYSELLARPESDFILNEEIVAVRLTRSLQAWLEDLFSPKTVNDIAVLAERQREIGRMHARINVPMHLVVEGVRILRRELTARIQESDMKRTELVGGIVLVNELLDQVMSVMNDSYIVDVVADERNVQSLQMHLSPHSLALELERLRASVFDWLASATAALLLGGDDRTRPRIVPLRRAEIGLWLSHKAPLISRDGRALAEIDAFVARVDETLAAAGAVERRDRRALEDAVRVLREEATHLIWLVAQLAGKSLEMEGGYDPMTRLFNRRYLPIILKHETAISMRHNLPFGALMVDIDHFKKINDTYGHDAGDAVIRRFAEILVESVRANDFVFRYGGEEYLIALGDADEATTLQIAEKIRRAIAQQSFDIGDGKSIAVTASIGGAVHDGHPDYQRTLARADEALYQAKQAGRNRCVVSPQPVRRPVIEDAHRAAANRKSKTVDVEAD